jgi:hypothetical protein
MKADGLGLPAVEKSLEKEDASANCHPTIIKSAEEPKLEIGPSAYGPDGRK